MLKYGENGARRLAGLELRREWMRKQIVLCVFFVGFQGVVENKLKVGGRGTRMVGLGHECLRGVSVVCVEKKNGEFVGIDGGSTKGIKCWALVMLSLGMADKRARRIHGATSTHTDS